jgi:beta-lactamase class A
MFKLFVLGALAHAVRAHRISWDQKVTVTAAVKTGGSGTLQNAPDGTTLTVEQAAVKMIAVSDNTAADLLLGLVGRPGVEAQVRAWSTHAALDEPFLSVAELFALKYDAFPTLADRYLALPRSQRTAFLTQTVDEVPAGAEQAAGVPRDINSIEWFASADDLCRAFGGLAALEASPGLHPIDTILSTNDGGVGLSRGTWPRVWFKGGSESGVLTLGYLARDAQGHTDVVVALTEDPQAPLSQAAAVELLAVIKGAFGLLR